MSTHNPSCEISEPELVLSGVATSAISYPRISRSNRRPREPISLAGVVRRREELRAARPVAQRAVSSARNTPDAAAPTAHTRSPAISQNSSGASRNPANRTEPGRAPPGGPVGAAGASDRSPEIPVRDITPQESELFRRIIDSMSTSSARQTAPPVSGRDTSVQKPATFGAGIGVASEIAEKPPSVLQNTQDTQVRTPQSASRRPDISVPTVPQSRHAVAQLDARVYAAPSTPAQTPVVTPMSAVSAASTMPTAKTQARDLPTPTASAVKLQTQHLQAPAPAQSALLRLDGVDADFDIEEVVSNVHPKFTPVLVDGAPVYNSTSILLACSGKYPHEDYYLYKNVTKPKCRSCKPDNKKFSEVRKAFEAYFKSPFVLDGDALVCNGMSIRVSLEIGKTPHVQILGYADGVTFITVRTPFLQNKIQASLDKLAQDICADPDSDPDSIADAAPDFPPTVFSQAAREVIASKRKRIFRKDAPRKTRAMYAARGNKFAASFADDVVPDEDARLLCIENCYCI